ncbi:MAG: hypothetical protein KGH60_00305 [Candidatus Micrarchaeota archaeon]|nr:hypothetical protein [Candidatus Micrarchaeota archaeon]
MGIKSLNAMTLSQKIFAYSKVGFAILFMFGFAGSFIPLASSQCTSPTSTCGSTACGAGCTPQPCSSPSGTWTCGSTSSSSSSGGVTQVNSSICTIYNDIHSAIFILGLALMILGGALYAGGHVVPGTTKGQIQGYGMGMLMGGVIGIIIALLSPYILGLLISTGGGSGSAQTSC